MSRSPQRRLRAALLSITLTGGLAVAALPALAAETASASGRAGPPAPEAAGTASGFPLFV